MYDDDLKLQFDRHEFRGELRLMALRHELLGWGIELRRWRVLPAPKPHFSFVTEAEFFTRKFNALQAQVFIKAVCDDMALGFACEAQVTGKHEFLRGGTSRTTFRLWV
jgi:hypothetical protein